MKNHLFQEALELDNDLINKATHSRICMFFIHEHFLMTVYIAPIIRGTFLCSPVIFTQTTQSC